MLLYHQGRVGDAEALCREALRMQPTHAGALHLLGIMALQSGRLQSALDLIGRSLLAQPNQPFAHSNLGAALLSLKRPAEALVCFERSLQLAPDSVQGLYNRGTALLELKRPEEALASFERALQLEPDYIEALNNAGTALKLLHRPAEALDSYERALRLQPDVAATLNNRGNVLEALSRHAQALESYDHAVRLRPDFAEAHINRGNLLRELGQPEEALASFEAALRVNPSNPEALYNRGNLLRDLDRTQEALESYERALLLRPGFTEALNARGNVLLSLKRPAEALASYDEALRLRPDFAEAFSNRGNALRNLQRFGEALASFERSIQLGEDRPGALGNYAWALLEAQRFEAAAACFARLLAVAPDYDYALGALCFARLQCCDWAQYQENIDAIVPAVQADKHVIAPFPMLAICDSPQINLRCARSCVTHRYPASRTPAWRGRRYGHDRIRVAYVSPDLRDHVVSHLLAPLIERHDRGRFEIVAISLRSADQSPAGQRIQAAFDRFCDVSSLTDGAAAAFMCDLEIDIAVDVGGFTGDQRAGIFAHRPAPVQVSYLGYPGTMGADYIDYLLADANVIHAEDCSYYSEKVVYLPDCYQVNHSERPLPDHAPTRGECGLPDEGFVFCCFNNSFKLTPGLFDIWVRILRAVPGSVLWLAAHDTSVVRNLRSAAAARDIDPERLIFAQRKSKLEEHLVRYMAADLFLDTTPFNAHATASDALWYGVPVVTCRGKGFAGRVAASLLHTLGLPELITENLDDYERRILELATKPALLADIRARLVRNRTTHALFDTDRFRRNVESAYVIMWERQERGEPPETFAVPPMSPALRSGGAD